jgi:hypothetical protein
LYKVLNYNIRGISGIPSTILENVVRYDLSSYYKENLQEKRSFCSKLPIERIMVWQAEEITEPLTKVTVKELWPVSIQIFRSNGILTSRPTWVYDG